MSTQTEKGQSLIEVLVVLAVSAVIMVALIIVILVGLKNAQFAQNQARATKYAQEGIDQVKSIHDRDGAVTFSYLGGPGGQTNQTVKFSDLYAVYMSGSGANCDLGGHCFFKVNSSNSALEQLPSSSSLASTGLEGGLSEQVIIDDQNATFTLEKKVTVRVFWQDSAGTHESNLQTILTKR